MKKILGLFLFFASAVGAFAQFNWRLTADLNTGLITWNVPTGERAEKFIMVGDEKLPNTGANNLNAGNRGDYVYSSGTLDVFSYGGRRVWDRAGELNLWLTYGGRNFNVHTKMSLNPLVQGIAGRGVNADNMGGGHSFTVGSGNTPNWGDFILYSFNEYFIRGNFLSLTYYVGNTSDQGKVNQFEIVYDDILRDIIVRRFSYFAPAANAADFSDSGYGQDVNNFLKAMRINASPSQAAVTADLYSYYDRPYLTIGTSVDWFAFPLTFQIAADPGNNTGIGGAFNYRKLGGAVRVSGENIANRITFDAIYKFRGGDPNTLDSYDPDYNSGGTQQPNGDGVFAHEFGVYANVLNVPDLGIAFGYSGILKTFEDDVGRDISRTGPLFSGIDLRFRYTGIRNLTLISQHNVSFAHTEKTSTDSIAIGLIGQALPLDQEQNWFATHNALLVEYRLTPQLFASFQVGQRYGKIITNIADESTANESTIERSFLKIGGGASIAYQFHRTLRLQGGIILRYENQTYTNSAPGAQNGRATRDASGGYFGIAVPIRMWLSIGS